MSAIYIVSIIVIVASMFGIYQVYLRIVQKQNEEICRPEFVSETDYRRSSFAKKINYITVDLPIECYIVPEGSMCEDSLAGMRAECNLQEVAFDYGMEAEEFVYELEFGTPK